MASRTRFVLQRAAFPQSTGHNGDTGPCCAVFGFLDHREVMLNAHPVREPPQGKAGADKIMELPGTVKGR